MMSCLSAGRRAASLLVVAMALDAVLFPAQAQAGAARGGSRQTLTGTAAQKSPQADLFVAYEEAMLDGGIEAADKYMSQAQRTEVKELLEVFGADGFKQMQAEKRKTRIAPAELRKRIQKVEISGDSAYLEARTDRQGVLDVAAFIKTADGWKVTPVRR